MAGGEQRPCHYMLTAKQVIVDSTIIRPPSFVFFHARALLGILSVHQCYSSASRVGRVADQRSKALEGNLARCSDIHMYM